MTAGPSSNETRPTPWTVWFVALIALGLRLVAVPAIGDATNFRTAEKGQRDLVWDWGYEQAAVAKSVEEGRGFADPFLKESGPTAWAAPAYPLLVAGLMAWTDGPTWTTALVLAALQALASALTTVFLFRLGRALHSERLGLLAAVLWAVHPMAAYLPVALVWDSTFVALGITWFLARLAEQGRSPTPAQAAMHGARFGLLLLVNPAPLALVPAVAGFVGLGRRPADAARTLATMGAAALLVSSPWTVRNAVVLGSPNVRTNLGVELFVGNNDGATGPFNGHVHPAYHAEEFARYVELGEVAYSADCRRRAVEWIRANPGSFARLTLERAQRFWVGPRPWEPVYLGMGNRHERDWQGWIKWASHALAGLFALAGAVLWRGREGSAWLVRGALVLFPLVYYVTHVFERYRFPIEPLVVLAGSYAVLALAARSRPVAEEPPASP